MALKGEGVRAGGGPSDWLPSKRLKASPNFPAKMDFLPRLERLDRLPSRLFLGWVSSMDRRKSTFDSMFMSSSRSKFGDGARSAGGILGEGIPGDPRGLEFFSCSRRKSRFDSRWVLTGRGREDIDLDFVIGSKFSMLGRPPSREGLDEDGCRE